MDIRSAHQRLHQPGDTSASTAAAAAAQHQGPSQPIPQAMAAKVQQAAGNASSEMAFGHQANEQLGTAAARVPQHCHEDQPLLNGATQERHCPAAETSPRASPKGRSKGAKSGCAADAGLLSQNYPTQPNHRAGLEDIPHAAAATVPEPASELQGSITSGCTANTGLLLQESCGQRVSDAAMQLLHLSHDLECRPSRAKELSHCRPFDDDADDASSSTAAVNSPVEGSEEDQPHQPATFTVPTSMLSEDASADASSPVNGCDAAADANSIPACITAARHADGLSATPPCVGQDEALQREFFMGHQQPPREGTGRARYNVVLQGVLVWYEIDSEKQVLIQGADLGHA